MPKKKNINLLPKEEFDASIVGRLLRWAMGTFRIIVIITEMIVMAAFLSRFWLDAKNSDLNDEIRAKSSQIEIQKDFETSFRNLQKKLTIYQELGKDKKRSEVITTVAAKIPSDVSLSSISVADTQVQLRGISGSELSIAQFVSNLKTEDAFKKVDLGQISSSENNELLTVFSIMITL
ncbi:MAG: PilN domain-containing protein [bacterium]|nr:PilN domain-containing protein [bacterium]